MRPNVPGRAAMVLTLVFVVAAVMLAAAGPSAAASLEARWALHARQDANSFVAGAAPFAGGYEVVSFAAAGPSANLAAFKYGGADLVPPQPPIVSCTATVGPSTLDLHVGGVYPFAGCVFFVAVENTGGEPIRVDLAALDNAATVTCSAPGCLPSDVDIVAGGGDAATIAALCGADGGTVTHAGARYTIPPGATFTCPFFVTVLQPAKENAQYLVKITPPPIDGGDPQELQSPTPSPSSTIATFGSPFAPPSNTTGRIVATPTPTLPPAIATPSPTPSPTPTAVETVAGARTPGPGATPLAPSTGSGGELIQRAPGASGINPLVVLAAGAGLLSALLWAYRAKVARDARRGE